MKIWVFAEAEGDKPTTATLELLTKAREVGDVVEAVYVGPNVDVIAPQLGEYGAAKVFAADQGDTLSGVFGAAVIAGIVDAESPDAILFVQSYDGRDAIGRLSARLNRTVLTNLTSLSVDGDTLKVGAGIFGGNTLVDIEFDGPKPYLAAIRPKSFAAEESGGGAPAVEAIDAPDAGATNAAKVKQKHVEAHSGPKLDEAAIVVSGGRGLGEAGNYRMIEDLAKLLKGAPGASRAIVDAGWVPYSYQVGQTGKVVKPTVYLAAGISGATQHMVGMKGAKNIIAINKDKEAPIFGIADLGIVGDVHKVLPKLIEALQAR